MTNLERMTAVATELFKLNVSNAGVSQLLRDYSVEEIERQLLYLPYRKAKRPNAFIIEAVRGKYSPPKEFTYAKYLPTVSAASHGVDEDPELAFGPFAPDPEQS